MTPKPTCSRPWYCNDRLVDDYKTVHESGGDLKMLKSLKIIRAIVVNAGIIMIALTAMRQGADPTIIGGTGLFSLAAYNGIEIGDYAALAQAIVEVSHEQQNDD